jgi:hypothetical protein
MISTITRVPDDAGQSPRMVVEPGHHPRTGLAPGGSTAAGTAQRAAPHHPPQHAQQLRVQVLTPLGSFTVTLAAEATIGEIKHAIQERKPEFALEQIELVCMDKDGGQNLFGECSGPRDDDETVESLWSDRDRPDRVMQMLLWIKEKDVDTGTYDGGFHQDVEAMVGVPQLRQELDELSCKAGALEEQLALSHDQHTGDVERIDGLLDQHTGDVESIDGLLDQHTGDDEYIDELLGKVCTLEVEQLRSNDQHE